MPVRRIARHEHCEHSRLLQDHGSVPRWQLHPRSRLAALLRKGSLLQAQERLAQPVRNTLQPEPVLNHDSRSPSQIRAIEKYHLHSQRPDRRIPPSPEQYHALSSYLTPDEKRAVPVSRRTVANDSANHGTPIYTVVEKVPAVFFRNRAKSKYDGRSVRNVRMAWTSPDSAFLWL